MNCPICKSKTRVLDVRKKNGGSFVQRRRKCCECGFRFVTYEISSSEITRQNEANLSATMRSILRLESHRRWQSK